jgi:hypothetical protein
MLDRLWSLFRVAAEPASVDGDYEPVYGLPRLAVEEWLAHNPQLREEYELRAWLARNPPAWHEFETSRRERAIANPAEILKEPAELLGGRRPAAEPGRQA